MKRIILLIFFLKISQALSLKEAVYIKCALQDKKLSLAVSIAADFGKNLDSLISDNPDLETLIEDNYQDDVNKFKTAVAEMQAKIAGKSATEAQIKKMLDDAKVTVPAINTKADALKELVKFFEDEKVGGKLLTAIAGKDTQEVQDFKAAVAKIKPQP